MNVELIKLDLIAKILIIQELGFLLELEAWVDQKMKEMVVSNPYILPTGKPMPLDVLKNRVQKAEEEDEAGKSIADEDLIITI